MKNRFQELSFLVVVTLFWFAQYVYIPYQVAYLSQSGVSEYFIGIVIGAYGMAQLLLRYPIGLLADCLGSHKRFIVLGCLASGGASLFRVIFTNGYGFLIGNIFSGIASAMWICFMIFYLEKNSVQNEQKATSKIVMFNNIGMLLGFIISMLTYSKIGMRGICFLSFLSGIIAWGISLSIYEKPRRQVCDNLRELSKVCKEKRLIIFSLLALIQQGIQLTTVMSFTNKILKDMGISSVALGFSSVIYMCSAVIFSGFASTKYARKKTPEFWIVLTFFVVAFYNVTIPNSNTVTEVFILQILPGMSTGILFSFLTSEAMKGIPDYKKATAMGFFQGVYAVGMTFFPIFIGKIAHMYDMKIGYYLLALISLLGIFITKRFYKTKKYIKF